MPREWDLLEAIAVPIPPKEKYVQILIKQAVELFISTKTQKEREECDNHAVVKRLLSLCIYRAKNICNKNRSIWKDPLQ